LRVRALQNISAAEEIEGLIAALISSSSMQIVKIWGSVALAEILGARGCAQDRWSRTLEAGLARAEDAGVREASWRLSYWLGILSHRLGDDKTGQNRLSQALRIVREIASHLNPTNRSCYLNSPPVSSALHQIASTR
jgi:hypothetical protein